MTAKSVTRPGSGGERRLPPAVAVIAAAVIYALLPQSLLLAPRLVIPAVELVLLVAVLATNTRRLTTDGAHRSSPGSLIESPHPVRC
jgi:hypothetical protein